MADLQDALPLIGQGDELVGLGQGGGHGLFQHDILPGEKTSFGHLMMQTGGHHHAHRINLVEQRLIITKGGGVAGSGDLGGVGRVEIRHPHQLHLRVGHVFLGVKLAEIAYPDNPDACFRHNYYLSVRLNFLRNYAIAREVTR